MNSFIKKRLPFVLLIGGWMVYVLIFATLKQSQETAIYAGFLMLISEVGLAIVAALSTFLLWKKRKKEQEKTIFALFCVSLLLLTIADASYDIAVTILNVTNYREIATSWFRIPFTGFLVFQLLAWIVIFLKSKPTQNSRTFLISYLPVALIILIIFTIFSLVSFTWKIQIYSLAGLYVLLDAIFQITGFVFSLLCLAIAANRQIRFIATGYLIIIAISFFTESSHLTQNLLPFAWGDDAWILGQILIAYGFINMLKNSADLKMDRWLNSLNSVQAQCACWSFVLCMSLLTAFCGILMGCDLLKMLPLQFLPSVLVVFSVFAVLISSVLARVLSAPFERVEAVIDSYMNEKDIDAVQKKQNSNIHEFKLLEIFLTKSFEVLKEKNRAQQELFNCATQVAHDIRSPLASLSMLSKTLSDVPEEKRILIRNATQRINDIANNLLETHKLKGNNNIKEDMKPELISSLLDSLASEKRVQLAYKSIDLILEIDNDAYSSFVNLESKEFKRVIPNLINNASEAIHGAEGIIRLTLKKESTANPLPCEEEHYQKQCSTVVPTVFTQARRLSHINNAPSTINHQLSTEMLAIKIIDNGKGIPPDILPKIKQGGMTIGKKGGFGLGIAGAIQNIKKWKGNYDILSKINEGTTFIIKLPIAEAPDWFQNKLEITPGMKVVVLDDDQSIHDVWETRFQEYIKTEQIVLEHFYAPSTFIGYCLAAPTCPAKAKSEGGSQAKAGSPRRSQAAEAGQNLSPAKTLFLIDYELLDSEETGLDLIEKLNLKDQAILVTSRYEEPAVEAKIIKLGIKTIPKNFAPYIPIVHEALISNSQCT